jgi:hypothetical protein
MKVVEVSISVIVKESILNDTDYLTVIITHKGTPLILNEVVPIKFKVNGLGIVHLRSHIRQTLHFALSVQSSQRLV